MRHPNLLSPAAIESAKRRLGNGAVVHIAGEARKPATERDLARTLCRIDAEPLDDISREWRADELEE